MPSVCLTYIIVSKEKTHWLALSMLIVILARGHGSGKVDRQWSNSDVSSGASTDVLPTLYDDWKSTTERILSALSALA